VPVQLKTNPGRTRLAQLHILRSSALKIWFQSSHTRLTCTKALLPFQFAISLYDAANLFICADWRISRLLISTIRRLQLLLCSRFLFRICDIACSHIARLADIGTRVSDTWMQHELDRINLGRLQVQKVLLGIADAHTKICAECQGRCCGGPRERDTFIDRVLQNPLTPHRGARGPQLSLSSDTEAIVGRCPQLTSQGCRLSFEQRPIQCVTYFCAPAAASFSPEHCRTAISCTVRLLIIELEVASVMIRTRLRHLRTNILAAKQSLADRIGRSVQQ